MFDVARGRSRGLMVVALVSACSALILMGQPLVQPEGVMAAPSEQVKPISHPVEGRENCLTCHQPGAGVKPAPADHAGRTLESCQACHKPAGAAVPAQPTAPAQPATSTPAQPAAAPQQPAAGPAQPAAPVPQKAKAQQDPIAASAACRSCHNQPEFDTVADPSSRPDIAKELGSDRVYAHRSIACVTCHQGDPHSAAAPVSKESIAEACGRCHTSQQQEYATSVHGQSLAAGGKDAASCVDCHSTQNTPHSIARVLSPESPTYSGSIAATCAKCHAKSEVMAQYGVPTDVYKTYMNTFHGKANALSPYEITQHPKATCISCHGYHDIKSDTDPNSPVAPANLAKTCSGCHPGAGEQFAAGWLGHKEATPQQFPAVYFAERFFFILTSTVLTFGFVFMVALELGSWILRRNRSKQ